MRVQIGSKSKWWVMRLINRTTLLTSITINQTGITSNTRVTAHNEDGCTSASQVAQVYGPACIEAVSYHSIIFTDACELTNYPNTIAGVG